MSRKYDYGAQRRQGLKSCGAVLRLAGRQSALEKGHPLDSPGGPPLPGPVPKPDAAQEEVTVVFRDFRTHHLGAKRNRVTGFRSGKKAAGQAEGHDFQALLSIIGQG